MRIWRKLIHKRLSSAKNGVWCHTVLPVLTSPRWGKVTCPMCLEHIPARTKVNLHRKANGYPKLKVNCFPKLKRSDGHVCTA